MAVPTPPRHRQPARKGLLARVKTLSLMPHSRRNRIISALTAVVVIAATVIFLGTRSDPKPTALPPTPPSPVAASNGRSTKAPPTTKATKAKKPKKAFHCGNRGSDTTFAAVAPYRICVPAIHVTASVMQLGLNSDHTVQVPPLSQVGDAGWYKYSAAPGTVGPTVILGHVDSAQYGDGVFFRLGQLRAGDRAVLTRGDGKIATYVITRVQEISKTKFPTQSVYGPTSGPAIRLVTCGGKFDSSTGNYLDNIIAYGTMQSLSAT